MNDWDAVLKRIDDFSAYPDDWDGEGSPAPTAETMARAKAFANALRKGAIDPPGRVVLSLNGSVYFEWNQGTLELL